MCDIKKIDEIVGLSDKAYKSYLGEILKADDAAYKIDELDDALIEIIERHPLDVERICKINYIVFAKLGQEDLRNHILAYNFNTLMISQILQNDLSKSKATFIDGIKFCLNNKQYEAGKSMSQNVFRLFSSNQIPLDEAPYFLTLITDFYKGLDKFEEAIEALCAAAAYFADASAFQSAYRAINDAQDIAITQKLLKSQIKIIETQGTIALIEGDFDCAYIEFQKCFDYFKSISEAPPYRIKANVALIALRKEKYREARDIYRTLLSEYTEDVDDLQKNMIRINLLVCYRELGDKAAVKELSQQIVLDMEQQNIETRIEARLVLSKTYFHFSMPADGTAQLKEACIEIQSQIDQYNRLHYRRGIREQYIRRIKTMLMSIKDSGTHEDVLHALVFWASNALTDWLSVVEWIELILHSEKVPLSVKDQLSTNWVNLIRYGTPFMYGFREKYDDPFEHANGKFIQEVGEHAAREIDHSLLWREFNDLTVMICQDFSYPSPLEGASIQNSVNLLKYKLSHSTAFLFSFVCKNGLALFFVTEKNYSRSNVALDKFELFFKALYEYQRGQTDRLDFNEELINLRSCLEPALGKITDTLSSSSISEFVHIPDHLTEGIPILPTILANEQLRNRIKGSGFTFRTCPAIKEGTEESFNDGESLFVLNSEEKLVLVDYEKDIVKEALTNANCMEIDLHREKIDFSKPPVSSSELLHLVTHSTPANIFTDPFFVSTSANSSYNSIWLESVQREAHKLNLKLVVLNGCNTGTTGNYNYFRGFLTNEKVGLTSAFLLNRQCTVIATQWNEPDIIGYIFSALFYKKLANEPNIAKSYILAMAELYELTKENAIALIENNLEGTVKQKSCDAIERSQNEYPFRNTYILGMFQCHSLLTKNGGQV